MHKKTRSALDAQNAGRREKRRQRKSKGTRNERGRGNGIGIAFEINRMRSRRLSVEIHRPNVRKSLKVKRWLGLELLNSYDVASAWVAFSVGRP